MRLVLSTSDLHFGRCNRQDNTVNRVPSIPQPFSALVDWLASRVREQHDVTLVLNGDTLDLWEVVPDDQLGDGDAENIRRAVAGAQAQPSLAAVDDRTREGVWQVAEIVGSHLDVFVALAKFANAGGNLHFNYGNHDHALANPSVSEALVNSLRSRVGLESDAVRRVSFDYFYEDASIGFFSEHGDQFAEAESRSPLDHGQQEAPGFSFLRFVWNRLEAAGYATEGSTTEVLSLIGRILFEGAAGDAAAQAAGRWMCEYFAAVDDGIVTDMVPKLQPVFDTWIAFRRPREFSPSFVLVAAARWAWGAVSHLTLEDLLTADDPDAVEPPFGSGALPGERVLLYRVQPVDPILPGIKSRFGEAAALFPTLDRATHVTLTAGHTHSMRHQQVFGNDIAMRARYLNTDTWKSGSSAAYYAWATDFSDPWRARGLRKIRL